MGHDSNEPIIPAPATRHDGWTGEAMAKFLETLAETGIVLDACDAAGKSSTAAYALRRREPLFAEAWEIALGIARDRLADTLLARSIEGNVEQIIKDGEIVAEKHFIDNRLGLAVLKRLDQRADGRGRQPSPSQPGGEPDWELALTALRTGEAADIASALAMLKAPALSRSNGAEVCEVCDPLFEDSDGDSFDHRRVWRTWDPEEWRTDFPPPPGFEGYQEGKWEDETYCRALSEEELAALVAAGIAKPLEEHQVSLEQDEMERQAFFNGLPGKHDASCPPYRSTAEFNDSGAGDSGKSQS